MPARLGTKHHASVATEDMVRTLRREYIAYVNGYKKLGKLYGLHESTVRGIVQYYTYKNVF